MKQTMLELEAARQKLEDELKQLEIEHARRRLEIQRSVESGAEHLGTLEARGRTAAQVRDAIRRLLIERKLKDEPPVTVVRRRRP